MPDLIAQGVEPQQRWRRTLPEGQPVLLGRLGGTWAVPWDQHVSRRHARLLWSGKRLEVVRLPDTRNPIFVRGKETDEFSLEPGEHFVIGQTSFTLADQRVNITADAPQPVQQQSFSAQYLRQVQFRNPDHRIEVLSRLPDVISGAAGDEELFLRLVSMILAGVPRADAAAVVAVDEVEGGLSPFSRRDELDNSGTPDRREKGDCPPDAGEESARPSSFVIRNSSFPAAPSPQTDLPDQRPTTNDQRSLAPAPRPPPPPPPRARPARDSNRSATRGPRRLHRVAGGAMKPP
jgi:hypothetical protein